MNTRHDPVEARGRCTLPLSGPFDGPPDVRHEDGRRMLFDAVEGLPLGDWDRHMIDEYWSAPAAELAWLASLLRRAHVAGVADGCAESDFTCEALSAVVAERDQLRDDLTTHRLAMHGVMCAVDAARRELEREPTALLVDLEALCDAIGEATAVCAEPADRTHVVDEALWTRADFLRDIADAVTAGLPAPESVGLREHADGGPIVSLDLGSIADGQAWLGHYGIKKRPVDVHDGSRWLGYGYAVRHGRSILVHACEPLAGTS